MNVKQGDIAITTHSNIEGNTGMLVEVIRFVGARDEHDRHTDLWLVRVLGSPVRDEYGQLVTEGYFPDRYLRPVSGLPVEEYDRLMEREPA